MKKQAVKFLLLTLLLEPTAFSAPTPLTWEEVRSTAEIRNLGLASAQQTWQSYEMAVKGSYGDFLPSISLEAERRRTISESYGFATKTKSKTYSVAASWNLFNGFASIAALGKARAQAAESLAARDATSVDLRYEIRRAFFNVYIQQERIRLFERTQKRQQQNEKLISLKYESGTEARWNLLKTRADRERADYNLESAKTSLATARDTLAQYLQVDSLPSDRFVENQTIQPPSIKNEEDRARSHPDLLQSQFNQESLDKNRTSARSAFLPSIDLSYSISREQNEIGSRSRPESRQWAVVAQWNIFNGFSDYYDLQQANLLHEAAELKTENLQRQLISNIRSASADLKSSAARLPSVKSLREAAEERVRTVSAQYRSGLKTYLDWEQAEAQLLEAEQVEITALSNALEALAAYERAIGITLEAP